MSPGWIAVSCWLPQDILNGFCITTKAYEQFVAETGLATCVAMELDRKSLDNARWEELWDAALRTRSQFRARKVPQPSPRKFAVLWRHTSAIVKLADCSGVAFARDPRDPEADCAVVEAVPGQCALPVDGTVGPDRWILQRSSGKLLEWRPGNRGQETQEPLLDQADLRTCSAHSNAWNTSSRGRPTSSGRGGASALVVLQARPITTTNLGIVTVGPPEFDLELA